MGRRWTRYGPGVAGVVVSGFWLSSFAVALGVYDFLGTWMVLQLVIFLFGQPLGPFATR